jgi:hypothetical protein
MSCLLRPGGIEGSAHEVVAVLAASMGRTGLARRHAPAALDAHRRLGVPYPVERSEELLSGYGWRSTPTA